MALIDATTNKVFFVEGAPFHEIDENRRQTSFRSPYNDIHWVEKLIVPYKLRIWS